MIITTTDPITGELLHDLDSKPFVLEGEGSLAVKIYFESEAYNTPDNSMGHYCY